MKRFFLAAGILLFLAQAGWWLAKACGPNFMVPVFSYHRHPDLPRSEFISGRFGVLQPTFARSYLVIAYRYLNGIGLNASEREQASDYYYDRGTGGWDNSGADWPGGWREVRSRIKNPPPPNFSLITNGQLAYDPDTRSFALNCAEDAFRVALHTLQARRSQFGASSAAFRSWLAAQDQVFANCDGATASIPQEASSDLPPLIRSDRPYQIAASHFYAGHYQTALDAFRRIGQDTSSPWNAMSRYLVVRTLFRMTQIPESAVAAGDQLRMEADEILADPKLLPVHGITWTLARRAEIREADHNYFLQLAHLLSSRGQDDGLREELWNYTTLYDRTIGDADPNAIFPSSTVPAANASPFADADLSDWIFSFQSRDAAVFPHSLARWKETRSPAWLLAALSHATAEGAKSSGLLTAAAAVPGNSPAFLTARFHFLRLSEEVGDRTAARTGLDATLASAALRNLPSSVNLFRGLRMFVSPSFEDFLHFALRKPVMITDDTDYGEAPDSYGGATTSPKTGELFDRDATRILNRETPFRLLKEAALGNALPAEQEREALMTAFTRGLMLGEDITEIAKKLATTQPDLALLANQYPRETTGEGRRFSAAFLLLHRPEARPYFGSGISRQTAPGKLDEYRDNWWCPMDIPVELDSHISYDFGFGTPTLLRDSAKPFVPEFLAGNLSADAKREFGKLGTLSAATDFLGKIVFDYAKLHEEDPRVPEALHDLVRSGHYGCADTNTWKFTRAAFRMLHHQYPKNDWTKRTPTWFKNDYSVRRGGP